MNEQEAFEWCVTRFSAEKMRNLQKLATMVLEENDRQNLISPATCSSIWSRHITDSAQLCDFLPSAAGTWTDVGSGAGFPGMVVAITAPVKVTLVEPRSRRAEFLIKVASALSLENAHVVRGKVESVVQSADVISARAVASLSELLTLTRHIRHKHTRLILPRGRNGASEVAQLERPLASMFHVKQSVTDPASTIVVADGVPI